MLFWIRRPLGKYAKLKIKKTRKNGRFSKIYLKWNIYYNLQTASMCLNNIFVFVCWIHCKPARCAYQWLVALNNSWQIVLIINSFEISTLFSMQICKDLSYQWTVVGHALCLCICGMYSFVFRHHLMLINISHNNNQIFGNISGRLGWTDDIDFDLNGELTSNNYLNK